MNVTCIIYEIYNLLFLQK